MKGLPAGAAVARLAQRCRSGGIGGGLGLRKTRRYERLAEAQTEIGMVLDGEPSACLSRRLAMPISGDTVVLDSRPATVAAWVEDCRDEIETERAGIAVVPLAQSHFLGGACLGLVPAAVSSPGASSRSSNNLWERVVELLDCIRTRCFVDRWRRVQAAAIS